MTTHKMHWSWTDTVWAGRRPGDPPSVWGEEILPHCVVMETDQHTVTGVNL